MVRGYAHIPQEVVGVPVTVSAASEDPPRLQAVPNFRDVGGHATPDGRRVRTGLLYRSVVLDTATEADLAVLAGLGIRTVFDLRTAIEQAQRPDQVPAGATHVSLDLLGDSGQLDPTEFFAVMQDPPRASVELADGAAERFFIATYRDLVRIPSARAGYARMYRTLAQEGARAALVHCTTGKDRTGWAVAALLLWLGVDREVVMGEYLISDAEIRRACQPLVDDFVAHGGSRAVIEPIMGVRASYLHEAIETMHAEYGSIDGYVRDGLGLEASVQATLRSAFLE